MATHTRAELREAARVLARAARAAGVEPSSSPSLAAVRRPALSTPTPRSCLDVRTAGHGATSP